MRRKAKYTKRSTRRINRAARRKRTLILFLVVAVFGAIYGGFIAAKAFNNYESVQASPIDDVETLGTINLNENEYEITDKTKVESGGFIQQYIYQQTEGVMPDGADGKKVVYLTFDDGPSTTVTPKILDILEEENVQATFFVLGKYIDAGDEEKELIKRAANSGNSIGIHSYSHDYNYLYPNKTVNVENFMGEVEKTKESIRNVLGEDYEVNIIRFPGGHMSWKGTDELDKILEEDGYSYIDWNALSKDAEGPKKNSDQLVKEAIKSTANKEKVVLLMHDTYGKEETVKSLPDIIEYYKENGYEFKVIK